ncbi:hypothetical protein C0J45_23888, partial [Silurus meridionalis]
WSLNSSILIRRAQQRLFFLSRLKNPICATGYWRTFTA